MAIISGQTTVADTATEIYTNETASVRYIHIHNETGGSSVFIGAGAVTITTGLNLKTADKQAEILLHPGDAIHGIVASGTQLVTWLVS